VVERVLGKDEVTGSIPVNGSSFFPVPLRKGVENAARDYHVPVYRVQEPELFVHQKQEDHDGTAGTKEILPLLPQASAAPGNQVE
jgi:hypothetical protein